MKPKYPLRRFFMLCAIALAGAVLAPIGHAQNLTHNAASTLNLGAGAVSYDNVLVGSGGGSASTIVDATGTTSFTSNGTQFYVGAGPANVTHRGTLNLGISNTITANQVTIGGLQPDANIAGGHVGSVTTLADGTTTINAANMAIGTGKGTGTFTLGSDATLNLYGLTGSGSRAALIAGRMDSFNARGNTGTMNLSGGIANLHLSELAVGRNTIGFGSGPFSSLTGAMTIGTDSLNHLNVSGAGSVVQIGHNGWDSNTTNHTFTSNGTLTIGNLDAASSITSTDDSTAILIGFRSPFQQRANGTLNMNGGTLTITTAGAAIEGAGTAGGTGAAFSTSTLNLSGGAKLVAGASSSDWIHSLTTATIGSGGATVDTNGHDLGVSQAFSGAGGLTKDGAGTLTLSATNTYTGATLVSGGTLIVNGSLANASAVTVESGATLGGDGAVGAVTLNGARIAPGASIGTFNTGTQNWGAGSIFEFEFSTDGSTGSAGSEWDLLAINGDLNITAPTTIELVTMANSTTSGLLGTWNPNVDATWAGFVTATGTINGFDPGSFSFDTSGFQNNPLDGVFSVALGAPPAGTQGSSLDLIYTANFVIPEPSKAILLALGLISLLTRRSR